MTDQTADASQEQDIATLNNEIAQLRDQSKMWQERDTDHQIRIQVLNDRVREMSEENTNVRVLASKLNMENQELRQLLGTPQEPSITLPVPVKKPSSKAALKASTRT